MWFNSTQREEPYLGSKRSGPGWKHPFLARDCCGGAAWLSSARVVRCWVKSRNERNPCPVLLTERCTLRRPPAISWRKVGMTSSHHGLYVQGYTRATMDGTKRSQPARGSESQKAGPGSDWRLKLASMKSELLVIANQQRRGEYVPGPCTHRPSHHESGLY